MRLLSLFFILLGITFFIGCETNDSSPSSSEPAPSAESEPVPSETPDLPQEAAETSEPSELEFNDAEQTETADKAAEAGVTHKGEFAHSSENPMSIIDVPLAAYFTVSEKTVFDMQIPQAMELYKASNGNYPQTEDEFMREIIQANNIKLPELKEGDTYFYNPETAQLMVHAQQ